MVSIIVPNYNHREFLSQRLDTIFNQKFQDFEVILLDDCSTDESWEYLSPFTSHPQVSHCIRNESNSGSPFRQWKKGIDLAKYEWIWIAESDDFSDLTFLEILTSEIDEGIDLIFSKSNFVDQFGQISISKGLNGEKNHFNLGDRKFEMDGFHFIKEYLIFRNYLLNASSVIFRKSDFFPHQVLNMKFAGDWYFWIDKIKNGSIVYFPTDLNNFRFHPNTTRIVKTEAIEFQMLTESIECIEFAKRITGIKFSIFRNNINFNEIVFSIFKLRCKFGRFRFYSFFPKIPLHFYLIYYKIFIKSFIKSKYWG